MAVVHLPRSLAALFPGTPRRLAAGGATVAEVIDDLDAQVPGLRNRILDAGPVLRTHINIFVAGQRATLETPVPTDAAVHVVPAVSGGEERFVPLAVPEGQPAQADPERGAAPAADASPALPTDDPRALQILATEHWSQLASRSLVYNETFARGGMFLALLSATLVALGLVSTASGFSDGFLSVAAIVLALDLFVGLATLGRIVAATDEDIRTLQAMNRIRHAYFEAVPGIERYFSTSGYDDFDSVLAHYGPDPNPSPLKGILHGFTTMPGMIGTICAAIAGGLAAVVTVLVTHDAGLGSLLGIVGFVAMFGLITVAMLRAVGSIARQWQAIFPRPSGPSGRPDD